MLLCLTIACIRIQDFFRLEKKTTAKKICYYIKCLFNAYSTANFNIVHNKFMFN